MPRFGRYSFVVTFIWIGFLTAISFVEAPLKFQAPSLTLPVGLEIGHLVFHALNKAEIGFAVLLAVGTAYGPRGKAVWLFFAVVVGILAAQTVWLLPTLDVRTLAIIRGETPTESSLHIVYIVLDAIKLLMLCGLGVAQLQPLRDS